MGKYIVKRLLMMIPVILAVAILIFTIMTFVPGNPASLILGADATEEQILIKEHELGLDQPYVIRLGNFLKQTFVDFDFGRSYWTNTSVTEELMARFPRTLTIAVSQCCLPLSSVFRWVFSPRSMKEHSQTASEFYFV